MATTDDDAQDTKTKKRAKRPRAIAVVATAATARDPLDGLVEKVSRWKELFIASKRREKELERVRDQIKAAMVAAGVEYFVHPTEGTIPLQHRAGATNIDWEGLARANLDPKVIEKELPKYTKIGSPSVVLAALPGWSAEAKSQASS